MPGDQKNAAKNRTAKFLKKNPNHFKELAAKRKGKKNPSKTKFTKKNAADHGAKGGKAGKGVRRKRRTREEIKRDADAKLFEAGNKKLKKMVEGMEVEGVGTFELTDDDLMNPFEESK